MTAGTSPTTEVSRAGCGNTRTGLGLPLDVLPKFHAYFADMNC
jgi:hypothetical protein